MQLRNLPLSFLFLLMLSLAANAELPVEVRADLLKDEIVNAVRAQEFNRAQNKIGEYRSLGLKMPAALVLLDAKVSAKRNDLVGANDLLEGYFSTFGKTDSGYNSALKLYQQVSGPAKQQRREQAAEKARLAKIKVAADKLAAERAAAAKKIADAKALRAGNIKACQNNDYDGCFAAGYRSKNGMGGPMDHELAIYYYKKACDGGHNGGCNNLGILYKNGYTNPNTGNIIRSASPLYLTLFENACTRTPSTTSGKAVKHGCNNWANELKKGDHDIYHLRTLYQRSCKEGNKPACESFKEMHTLVVADQKANIAKCEDENAEACHRAAEVYRTGIVDAESSYVTNRLYIKACDGGVAESCRQRGYYYQRQSEGFTSAYVRFKRGCELGDGPSCSQQQAIESESEKKIGFYATGCDDGGMTDCYKLGRLYLAGDEVIEDWEKGYRISARACELGELYSCYEVGFGMKQGRSGTDQLDQSLAAEYLKRACYIKKKADSGFKGFSCRLLGEVYLEGELVERSERKAKKYFKLGCKAEDEDSCRELKKL